MRFDRQGKYLIAGALTILVIAGGLWFGRGYLRDAYAAWNKPALPPAIPYTPPTSTAPVTSPVVTTTKPVAKPTQPRPTPTATTTFAAELNLAFPHFLQAPKQDWSQPFEDACEEASLIMVKAYYDGRKTGWDKDVATQMILDLVAWEDKTYGYSQNTTAADVANTAQAYFNLSKGVLMEATEANIKTALAAGHPVIAPAWGKALLNPNFKNGGPEYHMLVIKGYTKDGSWITNDPGTRNGADYIYPKQRLLDAIHDYNATDMRLGRKVVVVISAK